MICLYNAVSLSIIICIIDMFCAVGVDNNDDCEKKTDKKFAVLIYCQLYVIMKKL